jgi:hypothetical protein
MELNYDYNEAQRKKAGGVAQCTQMCHPSPGDLSTVTLNVCSRGCSQVTQAAISSKSLHKSGFMKINLPSGGHKLKSIVTQLEYLLSEMLGTGSVLHLGCFFISWIFFFFSWATGD